MKTKTSLILQIAAAALAVAIPCSAQPSFVSGSTGSDGALDFSSVPSGQTVVFDPTTYNPPLNPSHNNIFNFTTINIPSGVTVRLSGRKLTGPVYWLATGAVTIAGTLDLSGEQGSAQTNVAANRVVAYPGAGGYAGGLGGQSGALPTAGQGPAGGTATSSNGRQPGNGGFTGNAFLVPLIGGSGGGGADRDSSNNVSTVYYGPGGGAGGGAILIASTASIAVTGGINATGGGGICSYYTSSYYCAGGGGGAIHLVAPTISGSGSFAVSSGNSYGGSGGSSGRIRLETGNYTGSHNFQGPYTITATPNLYLPTLSGGTIKAISVNGVSLPASPTGSFVTPDVSINTSNSVPIVIQASNIPVGTAVTLQITSDQGSDMIVTCPALSGTLAASTTTATVVFPAGFSRGIITASW